LKNSKHSRLSLEQEGGVAIIQLTHPETRNPLSSETLTEIEESIEELAEMSAVHALIFTGVSNVFAAGADICEIATLAPHTAHVFAQRGQSILSKITSLPYLTIAAINGFCMGGGLDLALACKLRFASPHAVFSHPGGKLGIITGWGGTQRLPRLVGLGNTLELLLTARRLDAHEALRIGLINGLISDPLQHSKSLAITHISHQRKS
jgi:enoyl-CoA hydratase